MRREEKEKRKENTVRISNEKNNRIIINDE